MYALLQGSAKDKSPLATKEYLIYPDHDMAI